MSSYSQPNGYSQPDGYSQPYGYSQPNGYPPMNQGGNYAVQVPAGNVQPVEPMDRVSKKEDSNVDTLIPIFGQCCSISSIQTKNIMGCSEKAVCLCIEVEGEFCTFINDREGACFNCSTQTCICVQPKTCCKGVNRCFCLDNRFAIPCDDEVPCILNVCFINCCFNWSCKFGACASIATLRGDNEQKNYQQQQMAGVPGPMA